MTLTRMYSVAIKTIVTIVSIVLLALIGVQVSVSYFNKASNRMEEMLTLSNGIMQTNDTLIKLIRVYIVNNDLSAFDTYINILDDPESFNNKLDRMIEIGLDKTELNMVDNILAYLDILAAIEEEAIGALQSGEHDIAVSILFNDEYVSADQTLSQTTKELISHINVRLGRTKSIMQTIVSIILALTFLLLVLSIYIIVRIQLWQKNKVLTPIKQLGEIADQIAAGDIEVSLNKEQDDEIGALIDSFNNMVKSIKKQADVIKKMSQGDYVVDIKMRSDKDVLNTALKNMIEMTGRTLGKLIKAADEVNAASSSIEYGNNMLAEATSEQLSSMTKLSDIVSDLLKESEIGKDNAKQANRLAVRIKEDADISNETMKQMVDKMTEIQKSTNGISDIVKVIEDISFQTNLLALNASIEAAKAGELGRGFTVVADEVRKLASKSNEAVGQIASIISQAVGKTIEGTKMSNQAASALEEIMKGIDSITNVVDVISDTLTKQNGSIDGVQREITQISGLIQDITSSAEESAASSSVLSTNADELNKLVSLYKLS